MVMAQVGWALRNHRRVMSQPTHVWTEAECEKRGRDQGESLHRALVAGGDSNAYQANIDAYKQLLANETDLCKQAHYRAVLAQLPGINEGRVGS